MERRQFIATMGQFCAVSALSSIPIVSRSQEAKPYFGQFTGSLLLTDENVDTCGVGEYRTGADFRTKGEFSFADPDKVIWTVPSDACVNGASIPWLFQFILGSPWSAEYRRASVVHDYFCITKERTAEATHLAFYFALRAEGVAAWKAKAMYKAVLYFGPFWYVTLLTQNVTYQVPEVISSSQEVCAKGALGDTVCTVVEVPEIKFVVRDLEVEVPSLTYGRSSYEQINPEEFTEEQFEELTLEQIFEERPIDRRVPWSVEELDD